MTDQTTKLCFENNRNYFSDIKITFATQKSVALAFRIKASLKYVPPIDTETNE